MDEPSILFEDQWLLVVDKPSGLPTQGTRRGETGLYELLCSQRPYVGLHHRLDRPASGALLFTLDPAVNADIARALAERTLIREYAVIVSGRADSQKWTWTVGRKKATTDAEVVGLGEGLTALQCRLQTGRRHQIRVHASMAGHPVVGDRRYGGDSARRWPRLALHARRLALTHPVTGRTCEAVAPIPADLAPLWRRAGGTSTL